MNKILSYAKPQFSYASLLLSTPKITPEISIIFSVFRDIRRVKFLKDPRNALGFMNVILLQINHRHVSAIHVAIFRVMRKGIIQQLKCVQSLHR